MSIKLSVEEKSEAEIPFAPRGRRECRTFGDLMKLTPSSWLSSCKCCHAYGHIKNWTYSTRASICEACAIKRKDELLPHIATAERKARRWVNAPDRNYGEKDVAFLASISGASQDYVRELIRAKAARVAP